MSTNKNHERGKAFERAVVEVLRAHGHPYAERALRLGAHADRGDIAGVPGFLIDTKDCAEHKLACWIDELVVEAERCGGLAPALVLKRRGKHPERAYVVLELATFAEVIADG
jgi:hypothetical protein